MSSPVNRILIIKLSAFGDLLHAVPVAHRLAEHFGCPLDWVTQPEYVDLVRLHADVRRVIPFPRKGMLAEAAPFVRLLREESYDLAVDLQGLAKSGLVMGLCRARMRIACPVSREGSHFPANVRPPRTDAVHALDVLRDTLRYLKLDPDPVTYPMRWPEVAAPEGADPRIGFAVRSRWPGKDWPVEQFEELGRRLMTELGGSIHVFGGPGDQEIGQHLADAIGGEAYNRCGEYSLAELGGALRHMDVMVCNDTGPMHLAAAAGVPLVALFGPTDPEQTGPWGEGHVVLRPPPGPEGYPDHREYKHADAGFIARITVEQVYEAVAAQLEKQNS